MFRKKNGSVQGAIILKPWGKDTLKSNLAKFYSILKIYTNFQNSRSKTVGRVRDTKLVVSCTQTDKHTDGQAVLRIPPKTFVLQKQKYSLIKKMCFC